LRELLIEHFAARPREEAMVAMASVS
jgi:hypothetical protein